MHEPHGHGEPIADHPRSCPHHRTALGEPFTLHPSLVPTGESARDQLIRLGQIVSACEHNGYRLASHSHDVMDLSTRLAAFLGFDPAEIKILRAGAFIHDIGKVFTCLDVILSPKQGLDGPEWAEMMRHPEEGAALVTHPELARVRELVGCHHEWPGNPGPDAGGFPYPAHLTPAEVAGVARGGHTVFGRDGKPDRHGYPSRLTRDDLSDLVLLMSAVDWFCGCAEDRLYRRGQPTPIALRWTEEAAALGKVDPHYTRELGRYLAANEWHPGRAAITASSVPT